MVTDTAWAGGAVPSNNAEAITPRPLEAPLRMLLISYALLLIP